MAIQNTTLSPPAVTSFNSLTSSLTAVASSAAVQRSSSANVTEHEAVVTITGPATMTASASTVVNLFAYASADGTNWTSTNTTNELIDGTDKTITWSANGNQAVYLGSIQLTTTTAGTSIIYKSKVISIQQAFGCVPKKYVIVAQNQAGATLPASGHSIAIEEIYYN